MTTEPTAEAQLAKLVDMLAPRIGDELRARATTIPDTVPMLHEAA